MKSRVQLKIANIHFCFQSNREIPGLFGNNFFKFVSYNHNPPDAMHRIKIVEKKPIRKMSLFSKKILDDKFGFSISDNKSPILQCAEVSNKIDCLLLNKNIFSKLAIIKSNNTLKIYNFKNNTLDFIICGNRIYSPKTHCRSEFLVSANIRSIFSSFLTSFSAIMVHGSGVVMKPGAAIFFAPNEGGKSTVIALAKQCYPVLNDDQIILKKCKGTIYAHGTPFGALTSGPVKAKLSGIFMLKQSNFFKIEKIPALNLIECIWNEHINYTYFLPNKMKKIAFNLLFDAFRQAPTYRLHFPKTYINWKEIENTLLS